jgi:uncharacterized phage infection (PIP) family protein YhgE|tara:strand:+ start:512 stop:1150 length:639 start_codon:yes stop_codon:yes gene_type:complete
MEKSSAILVALVAAILIMTNNPTESISELNDRIVELELENSENEQTINENIAHLQEKDEEISQLNQDIEQQQHLISDLNSQVQGLLEENSALETEIENLENQLANASASIEGFISEIPNPLEGCYLLEPEQSWALDPCPPTIFIIGDNPSNWNQDNNSNYIDEGAACWNGTEWVPHEVLVSGQVVDLSRVATYEIRYDCGEATQVTRIVNVV